MSRTSPSQFEVMVQFMERNGDLNKPQGGPQERVTVLIKWNELSNILNIDKTGSPKPVERWKKVWSDLKNNTKRKAAKIHHSASGKGGGKPCTLILTDLEQRVLSIVKTKASTGLISIAEVGVERTQYPAEDDPLTLDVYMETVDDTSCSASLPSPPIPSQPLNCRPRHAPAKGLPSSIPAPPRLIPKPRGSPTPPTSPPSPTSSPSPTSFTASPHPPVKPSPRVTSPTPQPATSLRSRLRRHWRPPPTPFERAARRFTTLELKRLEMEETRTRLQHERDMRALEVEHERNQVFKAVLGIAQAWLNIYNK